MAIESDGNIQYITDDILYTEYVNGNDFMACCKKIGNHFETKQEAEKAVEKLKALARLEKAGLKIEAEYVGDDDIGSIMAGHLYYDLHCFFKFYYGFGDDLNTLFGGKE